MMSERRLKQKREANKRWRLRFPDRARLSDRLKHVKMTYGLDRAGYEALLKKQNGKCAICKVNPPTSVDHCHRTNKVRGLLCRACNLGIGLLQDSSKLLRAAINYLS